MSAADQPFLDAILARPADDGPRLVYADYLDEAGDHPRADLVRVQVALARLPPDHPRRPELADRQADLLRRNAAAWTEPLADLVAGVEFRRGIPEAMSVDAGVFLSRGDELFRRTRAGPGGRSYVRRVRLLDPTRAVADLARCPHLAEVAELDLSLGDLGNGGVNVLARSPYLAGLRGLDLGSNGLDDAGARVVSRSTAFPNLRSLALNDNGPVSADGVRAVADSPFLAGLVELDLSGNDVSDAGVRAVAGGRATGRVHTLRLAGNHIGDAGVAALVGSGLLGRLLARDPYLDLRDNAIGPAGAEALARCPHLGKAAGLDLSGNYLGDRGAAALAGSGRLAGLRSLRLGRNQLTNAAAFDLNRGMAGMPRLRLLDVSGNRLTWPGVESLRFVAAARGLTLETAGNGASPDNPATAADLFAGIPAVLAGLRRRISHPARRD
ncbi:MAG: TIGR02996 domain-containing protein [Gemmataceae bacterium]|nr:TIGR02996 domain-containing protein [Gemmataceae bacterium]